MTSSNKDKVAIITGAAGGIGRSLCKSFKKAGYFVVGTVRTMPEDTKDYDAVIQLGLNELVNDPQRRIQFEESVRNAIGNRPVKVLINNAAIQILGKTADLKVSDMQISFNVNVLAPFMLAQIFQDDLSKNSGSILNIGTVHARATKSEFVAYATSKTAMHGLTRALAVDLGGQIRVNTLAPAATATPMLRAGFIGNESALNDLEACHPIGRIADVQEISDTALFLCSDQASFITGSTIYADGGILSRLHDPA